MPTPCKKKSQSNHSALEEKKKCLANNTSNKLLRDNADKFIN